MHETSRLPLTDWHLFLLLVVNEPGRSTDPYQAQDKERA